MAAEQSATSGALLRRYRRARDLTQAVLAERAGCVVTTIKKIETGSRRPSLALAQRLADALGLSGHERTLFLNQLTHETDTLRQAGESAHTALPARQPALIGRSRELAALAGLLESPDCPILTLVGPGGVGKTRLAYELAARVADLFADGVCVVELAALDAPALVGAAIARGIGIEAGSDMGATLARVIGEQHILLVLDNFEHLLDAAPFVSQLSAACPYLRIMITSRVALRLAAERVFEVAALELPPAKGAHALDTYAAVQLFLRRARAAQADFVPSPAQAAAIAAICRRLDGLPLAIELAAARIRLLPPEALLRRLERGLSALGSGPQDAPVRHQSVRATLDWSVRLLNGRERRLFACLGVFAGGARLEAVETICCANERDPLAIVQALVEHSLAFQTQEPDGEPRIRMLQTIREYALEQLAASDELLELQRTHAAFFFRLAEDAAPGIISAEQVRWLDLVERDHDNMRVALAWLIEQGQAEQALRMAAALHWFWDRRGFLGEGRVLLTAALDQAGASSPELAQARGWALVGAAALAFDQGDWDAAGTYSEQAVACFRTRPDRRGLAIALLRLAFVRAAGQPQQAGEWLREAELLAAASGDDWVIGLVHVVSAQAALFGRGDVADARAHIGLAETALRSAGDRTMLAHTLTTRGLIEFAAGVLPAARVALEEGLQQVRMLRDRRSVALMAATTADVARCQADYARAAELYGESLALYHELGNDAEIPAILHNQAYVELGQHNRPGAYQLFAESLRRQEARGNVAGIAEGLAGVAAVACASGQYERAALLFGAAQAARERHQAPIWPAERFEVDRQLEQAHRQIEPAQFEQWFQKGYASSPEQLRHEVGAVGEPGAADQETESLTAREREVAGLVAQGHSNRAIAEALVISERTAEHHVANILAKLDFHSRAQIAAWAARSLPLYGTHSRTH